MSLELVLLVPVLVLMTLFVLWAGRGGRAGLTADLAAEEAATAAALCCEEGEAFQADRDALVEDILAARPGLQFLCIGGLRPAADPDQGSDAEFVQERWLEFEPATGVRSGGVGVLGVRFTCETDGAVAPLRGMFPTVTIHGQASEVVVRRPRPPNIGFSSSKFTADEDDSQLTFEVTSANPVPVDVIVQYQVVTANTSASAGSGSPDDYRDLGTPPLEVTIGQGDDQVDIDVDLFDDSVYEGTETLELKLLGLYDTGGNLLSPSVADIDVSRDTAVGEIVDNEARPYLFISAQASPCEVAEGGSLSFNVRLRDQTNANDAPSAVTVTVDADTAATGTGAGHATAGSDFTAQTSNTVRFNSGDVAKTVTVAILDDTSAPVGEPDETFKVELLNASGAPLGSVDEVTCTIEDDEVRVTVADVSADEGDDIQFELAFDRDFVADIKVDYALKDHATGTHKATRGTSPCGGTDDYLEFALTGTVTVPHSHDHTKPYDLPQVVTTCPDTLVEHDETFWLEISIPSGGGEAWVDPTDDGAIGTIANDDIPVVSISPASGSGTEGQAATVDFTVKLDDGSGNALELMSGNDITVDYEVDGSGTDPAADPGQTGADYSVTLGGTALTGATLSDTLTFSAPTPGQHVFAVAMLADYLAESSETLQIDLSNLSDPVGAAGFEDRDNDPLTDDSHADVTIVDDPPPEFSVSDFTGKEGTEQDFTVTLANPRSGETATVAYTIGGGTATAPGAGVTLHDYTTKSGSPPACASTGPLTGTLTFASGTTTQDVAVCLRRDTINETDETVRLTLSNPTNSVLKDHDTATPGLQAYGEGTIENADPPELFVDNVSASEGDALTFTVALCDPIPGEDVTVAYSTAARSATAGLDFTAASGTLTFLDTHSADSQVSASCGTGATESKSQTVSVTTLSDAIAESDEEVHLVLSGQAPSHVALGKSVGVGQIVNRNPATVRVDDASAFEGASLGFEITLEDDSGNPATITKSVTVNYATADRTATAGSDYTAGSGTVTFDPADNPTQANPDPAGRRHAVAVSTSTDTVVEGDETMALVLTLAPNTDNAGLGDSQGIGTISDRSIYFRIDSPAGVDEGGTATFTVGLYDAGGALTSSSERITVDYATADRTAKAAAAGNDPGENDYTAGLGTVTFSPGDQQKTIDVVTLTDSVAEPEETFRVDLSGPVNAILDKAVGVGTINANLDPELSVSDASVRAGGTMVFTVTLDAASASTVTVDYATSGGTATAGSDYTAVSDTLTFSPGDTTATIDVVTVGDSDTSDETFQMVLSKPTNATIDVATGVGTILAATLPALRIADASGPEGSDMSFAVTLSAASTDDVSFVVDTSDGTAAENADYEPIADTRHRITAGSTQTAVDVEIKSDSVDEYVETFFVALSNPTNATIVDGTAVGDIDGDLACVDMRNSSTDTLPTASITGTSADENDADGRMDMTITVTQAMCQDYDFRFTVSDDTRTGRLTATLNADYRQPSTVRLGRGQTSVGFSVPLIDDDVVEGDETFELVASSPRLPGRRVLADVTVYPTIVEDDEAELQLPADGEARVSEGGWLGFVVRLDQPSVTAVTFDYATSDGSAPSAAAGADYVAATGTATISAGALSVTVTVRTVEDSLDELDENVDLTVSNVAGVDPDPDGDTATGVIVDDDDPPAVRVADAAAVDEGGKLSFAVTLDAPSGREVTVKRATRDGTAKAAAPDSDYDAMASGDVVFAAGVTSQAVEVQTNTDSAYESTERMYLDLSSPDGATIADSVGVGEIRDATDRRVTVSDASAVEGGTLSFVVSLVDGPASRELTVNYQTKAGTATAGTDYDNAYESAKQELKFLAGDQSLTVLVPTVQDKLDEDLESLDLSLSDPVGAVIIDGTATGVIIDDDPLPALRVGDTTATEGPDDPDDPDDAKATFTLSLDAPSGRDVTVGYSTADGLGTNPATAASGDCPDADNPNGDYCTASGSLTIDAGDLQASVDVDLVNDDVAENVERFRLRALSAVNAVIDDSTGVATVTDDDGLIQILMDNPADVYEGDGASAVFTVRLSRADGTNPVTVSYATQDGTAKSSDDYTATSGTLTFDAGDTSKTVSVALVNDDIEENSETFRLVLSSPSANASLGNDRASVLILDDDGLPTLSAADASATEGSDLSFTVTLSRSSARAATVAYRTLADPIAPADTAATAGVDYTAATGTATIAARSTAATVTVASNDDSFDENNETFWLRLGSPTGATVLDGTATGTITDDDPQPKLRILDASADEGSSLTFEVRLDTASGRTVTVPWATKDLSPGPDSATAGSDYTAASGTLTFASGTTTASVTVASLADDVSEKDERFQVQLSTPVNAVLDDGAAVGRIIDDDGLPRVSISDVSVDEDDGPAVFKVALSRASSQAVTVSYTTADGTATNPDDYAPDQVRTLTIPASATEGEISVFIADDDLDEGDETFTVTLASAVNAVVAGGAGTATGTIVDDEGVPKLTISDADECEDGSIVADCQVRSCRETYSRSLNWGPDDWDDELRCWALVGADDVCQPGMCGGNDTIDFTVELSHAAAEEASVRYTTFAGTADSPGEYVGTIDTLTIPAGDTSASIPITLVDDVNDELDVKTFRLVLDNPVGVELETAEAVGTIRDDDFRPRVSAGPFDTYANENDGHAYHRVTLSNPSELTATVGYYFQNVLYDAAKNDSDYSNKGLLDCAKYPEGPGIFFNCQQLLQYCSTNNCQNHITFYKRDTLTFAPGVVEQTISVPLIDNSLTYTSGLSLTGANVTYQINLTSPVNARSGRNLARGVVWDDETAPYVSSVGANDVLESAGEAVFTITLNRIPNTGQTATVSYSTSNGTATAGSDYTSTSGSVTFSGTNTATVSVPITDDTAIENDETFTLTAGSQSATVTIIDDDTLPVISVSDSRANEDAGTMPFQVSLSRVSDTDVTVQYATADGTATQPGDYTSASGTLTIPDGTTGASLSVTIIEDSDDTESNETFTLGLSNATGATIASPSSATGTIIEDANLPAISMADVSASENITVYSRFMDFRAWADKPAPDDILVDWQVREVPSLGDRAATIGSDFRPCVTPCSSYPTSGTLTIPKGLTYSQSLKAEIVADALVERDERFQVVLSNPRGATLDNSTAWGTILNDDLPIVSVADVSASESAAAVVFTVQLHAAGLDPASLDYTTVVRDSAGDKAASPGDDYTTTSGTLNFAAGTTTATVSVPIIADAADEHDETFLLQLSKPKALKLSDAVAVGTITDDDNGWWIDDRSVWENAGPMVFTIERDHTSDSAITVNYRFQSAVSASGGASCTSGVDFVFPSGSATGTVSMPADGKSVTLSVALCDDSVLEGRENFLIELVGLSGRKTTGTGTIVDDDKDKPPPPAPAAPTGLAAAAGDGSVTVSWSDPSNSSITSYEYQVNHNDTATDRFTGWSAWTTVPGSGVSTTSHVFSGLTNGKEYRYKLRAVNNTGNSPAAPRAAPWYVTATPTS